MRRQISAHFAGIALPTYRGSSNRLAITSLHGMVDVQNTRFNKRPKEYNREWPRALARYSHLKARRDERPFACCRSSVDAGRGWALTGWQHPLPWRRLRCWLTLWWLPRRGIGGAVLWRALKQPRPLLISAFLLFTHRGHWRRRGVIWTPNGATHSWRKNPYNLKQQSCYVIILKWLFNR